MDFFLVIITNIEEQNTLNVFFALLIAYVWVDMFE